MHDPQPQIRQFALEHAVGYTQGATAHVFKQNDLKGVKDLKILIMARQPVSISSMVDSLYSPDFEGVTTNLLENYKACTDGINQLVRRSRNS